MRLADWIEQNGYTPASFAREMDYGRSAIIRILAGERIPRKDLMRRMFVFTGGLVDPNSFYDLPDLALTAQRAQDHPRQSQDCIETTANAAHQSEAA